MFVFQDSIDLPGQRRCSNEQNMTKRTWCNPRWSCTGWDLRKQRWKNWLFAFLFSISWAHNDSAKHKWQTNAKTKGKKLRNYCQKNGNTHMFDIVWYVFRPKIFLTRARAACHGTATQTLPHRLPSDMRCLARDCDVQIVWECLQACFFFATGNGWKSKRIQKMSQYSALWLSLMQSGIHRQHVTTHEIGTW